MRPTAQERSEIAPFGAEPAGESADGAFIRRRGRAVPTEDRQC